MSNALPNAITWLRIGAIPVLLWLCAQGNKPAFTAILVLSLVGDILDGLLARWLQAASPFGAALDSVADTLLLIAAALGAWTFYPAQVHAHFIAFLLVPALWLIEVLAAMLRYGRLSSFHTYSSRAAGYAMGIFIGVLFYFDFSAWLMYLAAGAFVVASAEEFVLLWLLPQWIPDVRGAYWAWRDRQTLD